MLLTPNSRCWCGHEGKYHTGKKKIDYQDTKEIKSSLAQNTAKTPLRTDIENCVLQYLSSHEEIPNSSDWASENKIDHDLLEKALTSLNYDAIIIMTQHKYQKNAYSEEAEYIIKNGSPEYMVWQYVHKHKPISQKDLGKTPELVEKLKHGYKDGYEHGFASAMKYKYIKMITVNNQKLVTTDNDSIDDRTQNQLIDCKNRLDELDKKSKEFSELKKRNFVLLHHYIIFSVKKGPNFASSRVKYESDITAEMINSKSWKKAHFKEYNCNVYGAKIEAGNLHPLTKIKNEFKQVLLEMGFEEMGGSYVVSSFWNFDALFQPQFHPARDAHDTFFVETPRNSKLEMIDSELIERVKKMHQDGDGISFGYKYEWKIEEALKNIMRTHTTAISSQVLYEISRTKSFPRKFFSIDRVFRNEAVDASHLAEFHQIEGFVADYNLTLANLMGIITEFYKRYGIENIRYKPAYNPYTEPSMEIFAYSKELDKEIEIGNSGMFRPEMLVPLGVPKGVNVIAWGLSLERPTMIKYNIANIRELLGPRVDINMVRSNPICMFE